MGLTLPTQPKPWRRDSLCCFFSEAGEASNQDASGFRFRTSAFHCVYRLSSARKKKNKPGPIAGGCVMPFPNTSILQFPEILNQVEVQALQQVQTPAKLSGNHNN